MFYLVEFLENRRSWENQKLPENRQKNGLFWASPFTMHLVCTLLIPDCPRKPGVTSKFPRNSHSISVKRHTKPHWIPLNSPEFSQNLGLRGGPNTVLESIVSSEGRRSSDAAIGRRFTKYFILSSEILVMSLWKRGLVCPVVAAAAKKCTAVAIGAVTVVAASLAWFWALPQKSRDHDCCFGWQSEKPCDFYNGLAASQFAVAVVAAILRCKLGAAWEQKGKFRTWTLGPHVFTESLLLLWPKFFSLYFKHQTLWGFWPSRVQVVGRELSVFS